jgi:hypothetical protein
MIQPGIYTVVLLVVLIHYYKYERSLTVRTVNTKLDQA